MTYSCPYNPEHNTVVTTDHDDSFTVYTCVSCNQRFYESNNSDPTNEAESGELYVYDDYDVIGEYQADIIDEEKSQEKFCSEVDRLY